MSFRLRPWRQEVLCGDSHSLCCFSSRLPPWPAATFTVTNTNDSGAGSLRQAILDANANPGLDTIAFNISGSGCAGGVCTIKPLSALHWFTSPVTIDGYTQTGAATNTNASGALNAVLKIVLSGVSDPDADSNTALEFLAGSEGSTVKGLVINGFDGGIAIWVSNVVVQGCYIGTDATGMTAVGDNRNGLYGGGFSGASALTVGGPEPADRNLISGNWGQDVALEAVAGATIEGNLIGTDATGAATLPMANPIRQGTSTPIQINSVGGRPSFAPTSSAPARVRRSSSATARPPPSRRFCRATSSARTPRERWTWGIISCPGSTSIQPTSP